MKSENIPKIIIFPLILIYSMWLIYVAIVYPPYGIYLETKNNQWYIKEILESEIKANDVVQVNDRIISINGLAPDQVNSVRWWSEISFLEELNLILDRNGNIIEVLISDVTSHVNLLAVPGIILSFIVASTIYFKVNQSRSSLLLTYVFINIGIIFMCMIGSVRGDIIGKTLVGPLVTMLPFSLLLFLKSLLYEKGNFPFKRKILLLLPSSLFIMSIVYSVLKSLHKMSFVNIPFLGNSIYVFEYAFVLGMLLNFYVLTKVYFTTFGQKNVLSTLIKTIWITLFLSMSPLAFASFFPYIFFGNYWIDPIFTGWFVLLFPLSFAYLIATKQIFDIQLVLRRLLFTLLIATIPSAIINIIGSIIYHETFTPLEVIIYFFSTLIIITIVLYSLEYILTKLERIMFPRKYYLKTALKKISRNLGKTSNFRALKDMVLTDIIDTLEVHGGAIVFDYYHSTELIVEGTIDSEQVEGAIRDNFVTEYKCLEIYRSEEYTCYLILTPKKTGTLLSLEELQWIDLIISYLAVSLENVYLIRKITSRVEDLASNMPTSEREDDFVYFRKMMFEIQEKERMRIATDIHDTTMQDLFFLKQKVSKLAERYILTKEDRNHLESLQEFIDIINVNLRENCFELYPYLLDEIGLAETVHKVIDREKYDYPFPITFKSFGQSFVEQRGSDFKRHVFRMIQELINNAKKHSKATKVNLWLSGEDDQIVLVYEDNGVGFDPGHDVRKDIGGKGVGFEQLRSRILYLKGNWTLDTSPGKGMKLKVTFPIPIEGDATA